MKLVWMKLGFAPIPHLQPSIPSTAVDPKALEAHEPFAKMVEIDRRA
jgi:hypothetical protein